MKKEYIIYIAAAIIIIAAVAAYLFLNSSSCSQCGKQVSAAYLQQLHAVANNETLATDVGAGLAQGGPTGINAAPLTFEGKPEILYVGGEFCPYCAVTRWGLIIALMRFGTFNNLTYMESSPTDAYPNTPTFSFVNSSYSSSLVYFSGIEVWDRYGRNLSNNGFTPMDQFIYGKYSPNGVPFIDFANASVQSGAVVTPGLLRGKDWNYILSQISNPNTPLAQGIIGNANLFTAYMCKSNKALNQTAAACKQPYVKQIIG